MTWKTVELGDLIVLQRGHDLPSHSRVMGSVPIISSSGVSGFHHEAKENPPGVVTGRYGTIGKIFYVNEPYWPLNTTLYVKDFKGNNPKFIAYLLECLNLEDMNAAGAVPGVNRNHLYKIRTSVPTSKALQDQIAAILSAYDDLIENNLLRIKLLEEMAQITYEEWFVRMKFPGHETAQCDKETGLPEGWKERLISDFCEAITDGTHDSPKEVTTGYPLITGKHIENGFINFETAYQISKEDHDAIKKRSGLGEWDILFSNIGTLGSVGVVIQDFEFSCKNVIIFKRKIGFEYFLYSYLSNPQTKKQLDNQSSGVAQKFYSLGFIRGLKGYFPNDEVIHEFNKKSKPLYRLKYQLAKQNALLREAREILLPRLMTGVIDVDQVEVPEALLARVG